MYQNKKIIINPISCDGLYINNKITSFLPHENYIYCQKLANKGTLVPGVLVPYYNNKFTIINWPVKLSSYLYIRYSYINIALNMLCLYIKEYDYINNIIFYGFSCNKNKKLNWLVIKQIILRKFKYFLNHYRKLNIQFVN